MDLELEVEPVHKNTNIVINGRNEPFKNDNSWMIKDVPYSEPSEFELKLLEGTTTAKEYVEKEKKEIQEELTEEQKEEQKRRSYITKVKVVALFKCKFHPVSNPSTFNYDNKLRVIKKMEKIIKNYTEEELTEEFNLIINNLLLDEKTRYEDLPIMRKV